MRWSTCRRAPRSATGDIFAQTPAGKLIGSFMMTVGPARANAALVGGFLARQKERDQAQATQQELLATMKEILAELRKANSSLPA